MKLPVVDKSLCGCTLRTACLIIGSIFLVASILMLISSSAQAENVKNIHSAHKEVKGIKVLRGIFITYAIISAVEIVINICLLYGTIKCRALFIFIWVLHHGVSLVIYALLTLVLAIVYFVSGNIGGGIGLLIVLCINASVTMYLIILVNSHYLAVKGDSLPASVPDIKE